jgi:hypothetical protein
MAKKFRVCYGTKILLLFSQNVSFGCILKQYDHMYCFMLCFTKINFNITLIHAMSFKRHLSGRLSYGPLIALICVCPAHPILVI